MNKMTKVGELVKDYCISFPDVKDKTLGRKIFKENPGKFTSLTRAYDMVRYYRGHRGEHNRRLIADKATIKPKTFDTVSTKPYKEEVNSSAKILILDIETAPLRAFVWDVWNQNINIEQIENDWFILTWSAKWLFERKVFSGKLTSKEAILQDDARLIKGIWELLNQADVVIAHNGDKFDLPRMNTRFIINRMNPPLPYQSIDTLKTIRRQFAFVHNKLDFVNKVLGLPRKTKVGQELWNLCYIGNEAALTKMERYNVNDVKVLEETYLRLRPWIKPHPNIGLFILDEHQHRCPTCGSDDLKDEGKKYITTVNIYEQLRCNNCGAVGRKRTGAATIKERRHILSSVPK